MEHLHYDFDANADDMVEVTLNHAANVQLMDSTNYDNYKNGRPFRYHGGYITNSPFRIAAPREGRWHVVIDLGGTAGSVQASARLIRSSERAAT